MSLYVYVNAQPEAENTRTAFKVVSVFSSVQNVGMFICIMQTVLRRLEKSEQLLSGTDNLDF
jgi:hypothetical protein